MKPINLKEFENSSKPFITKYGLPENVIFCKSCTISNQRPNSAVEFKQNKRTQKSTITFNENGICDACKFAENKKNIDWKLREKELKDICDKFRKNDGSYDCIIPGSGGKDSFFTSHILKFKYNMNPLTVTWAPNIYTSWGWKNFQSWIGSGFDNQLITPNSLTHRLLTRLSLEKIFHPFQAFILGQKNIAPRISKLMNIPLVFYGENEAEYGNPIENNSTAIREDKYFQSNSNNNEVFIGGTHLNELIEDYGLTKNDLKLYLPLENITEKKTEVHYLGYYLRWHPQGAYYYSIENGDFTAAPERTPGTYSKYNSIDDKIDDFHFYTYYIKFGIGRATYDSSQEIRNNDITREEGIELVKKYDGEFPERFSKEIFQYLSINKKQFPVASKKFEQPLMNNEYFNDLANSFRSQHIWNYNGNWKLRNAVWY